MAPSSFDATARINVDLRGFSTAAGQVMKSGGQMEQTFRQLHAVLGQIPAVEKETVKELRQSLAVYNQISGAAKNYANAVKAMAENEQKGLSSTQHMAQALEGLKSNLAQITGISDKEAARLRNTLDLYDRMATVLKRVADAQQAMMTVTQKAEQAEQRKAQADQQTLINEERLATATQNTSAARSRAASAATGAVISEERLATAQNNTVASAARAAAARTNATTATERLTTAQNNVAASESRVATAENNAAASAARLATAENNASSSAQRLAAAQTNTATAATRLATAQSNAENAAARSATAQLRLAEAQRRVNEELTHGSGSGFQMRSALGEIEGQGQSLMRTLASLSTAIVGVAISHEASFAQVHRVLQLTTDEAEKMSSAFQKIAVEFPISREEVDRIGQLSGQLGIGKDEMDSFVRSVAQFSITTGISAEQTTLFIGRIKQLQNVPVDQVNNLASTILRLGTISAATEEQIVKVEESISTVSNVFGLTVQATTALAASFATLNVKPELSRGTLTRVFGQLEKAINGAGDGLNILATMMNLTTEEVLKLRRSNPDEFLVKFVQGLHDANEGGHSFRETLSSLGINAVRDIDSFSRLGNNVDVLKKFMLESNKAWTDNNELQKQSGVIFDTTQARLGNLKDAFASLLGVLGGNAAKALGELARGMTNVIESLVALNNSMGGALGWIGLGVAGLATLGAAFLAYKVVLAKVIQGITAYREVQEGLGTSTLSLQGAVRTWIATSPAAVAAARAQTEALLAQQAAAQRAAAATAAMATSNRASASAMSGFAIVANQSVAATEAQRAAMTATATSSTAMSGALNTSAAAQNLSSAAAQRQVASLTAASTAQRTQAAASIQQASAAEAASVGLTSEAIAAAAAGAASATASIGMRALTLAAGPLGLVLTAAGIAMSFMSFQADPAVDVTEELAKTTWNAVGGMDALKDAMMKDAAEFATSGKALSTWNVELKDVNQEVKDAYAKQLDLIAGLERTVAQLYGSEAAMRKQAEGTGTAAESARKLTRELDGARDQLETQKLAVQGNTIAIGENTAAKFRAAAQEALLKTAFIKSAGAVEQLKNTGLDLSIVMRRIEEGNIDGAIDSLTYSLTNAQAQFKRLTQDSRDANQELARLSATNPAGNITRGAQEQIDAQKKVADSLKAQANDAKLAVEAIETLSKTMRDGKADAEAIARAQSLLGGASGDAASKAKGLADALDDQNEKAEENAAAIEALASAFEGLSSPATAWKTAMDAASAASDENAEKTKKVTVSIKDLMKAMEEAVAAQRDYATNLVSVMSRVPADVATELAKMGPEAAGLIKLLTEMSKPELDKYVSEFRATGEGARAALAKVLVEAAPVLATVGGTTGAAISKALGDSMNSALAAGGNVETAVTNIGNAIKVLGLLRADPKVNLDKAPFEKGLAEVIAQAYETSTGKKLDTQGRAKLAAGDYNAVLSELESRAKGATSSGSLDVDGAAKMRQDQWDAKVKELERLAREKSSNNSTGITGLAYMNTDSYYGALGSMSNTAQAWSQRGYFSPRGWASVDTGAFYASLDAMSSSSYRTGQAVKANLTQSANITYYYRAGNSPPDVNSLRAAGGGWINGPGGPREDRVPAMLSNGEFVVNAAAASKYASLLETINSDGGRGGSSFGVGTAVQDPSAAWSRLSAVASSPRALVGAMPTGGMSGGGSGIGGGPQTVITVNNTYPRAEPTSTTINRSLAYAATLSGV